MMNKEQKKNYIKNMTAEFELSDNSKQDSQLFSSNVVYR